MIDRPSFFAELKRRNVLRAAALYIGAAWALSQGVAQLLPVFDIANWVVRWFVIAAAIGFPFAMLFSWFYEWTPHGIQRESEVETDASLTRETGKKMDRWIIAVLSLAVVLLLTNQFVLHKDGTTGSAAPAVAAIIDKSIAVLPLANESGDKGQQFFSDGLSEDLITALSQFNGLKVISRDSSFRFRNSADSSQIIGKKLGVAHLLEGTVSREGDEVRISAELVNAADGATLWSEHYDRPYKDLFALQDDITKAVATALQTKLLTTPGAVAQSERPPSGNLAAYNAYLQGQFYYQRGSEADLHEAIAQFTAAIRLDPQYAAAYAAESQSRTLLSGFFLSSADEPGGYAKARTAAETALRLNPDLAAAHDAYGNMLNNADFDWHGALAQSERALELAPGSASATFHLSTDEALIGHPESAVKLVRQALTSNPLQAFWTTRLASFQAALGQLDAAEATARRAVALQPEAPMTYRELTAVEVLRGDAAAALAAARSTPPGRNQDMATAWATQIAPDRAAADAALKNLIDKHSGDSSYQIAEVYALRKDPDNLFKWLDQAWLNRDSGIQYLLYDPFILRYRDDPRFAMFCKKVGLPTTTDAKAMP